MKTPLPRDAFQSLVEAVGEKYVKEDDSIVSSYGWNCAGGAPDEHRLRRHWASAIVMPSTTEEVQAIVIACNKFNIRFRAISTGVWANNEKPGHFIVLDMRRMNRCDIDAKNQMAVIEPYVTAGNLQAEAIKSGLTCHIVGAGPGHSPLASATSVVGIGISGATTGLNQRNLLAVEWVTPEGKIVRIGTPEAGAGWYSGEGPGPGFRGMIRGDNGAYGGLGVFTKIGYKLHPWKGARKLKKTGVLPQFGLELSPTDRFYQLAWDDWEGVAKAGLEFNRSRIADFFVRTPSDSLGAILTTSNNEFHKRYEDGTLPHPVRIENKFSWTLLTVSASPAEAAYKHKVIEKIIKDTGARLVELAENEAEILALNLVNSPYVLRYMRAAPGAATSLGVYDNFRILPKTAKVAAELLEDDVKKGNFMSTDAFWAWPNECRSFWAESGPMYSTLSEKGKSAGVRYFLNMANQMATTPGMGVNGLIVGPVPLMYSGKYNKVDSWMRKVKVAYDAKNLAIDFDYISPKGADPVMKAWPVLGPILFSKIGKPLLEFQTDQVTKTKRLKNPKK